MLDEDVIKDVLPLIRKFCLLLDDGAAIPHVCAGVRSILHAQREGREGRARKKRGTVSRPKRAARRTRKAADAAAAGAEEVEEEEEEEVAIADGDVPALVLVVLLLVRSKRGLVDVSDSHTLRQARAKFDALARKARVAEELGVDLGEMEAVEGLWEVGSARWVEMEWYQNIGAGAAGSDGEEGDDDGGGGVGDARGNGGADVRDADDEGDGLAAVSRPVGRPGAAGKRKAGRGDQDEGRLRPGLGTMFCQAVDWLSDERRAHYAVWKRQMEAQIASMS